MKSLWQKFTDWVKAKGGATHVLVGVYVAALLWFKVSPAFHDVCVQLWAKFPSLLQTVLEAVQQILAIYGIGAGVSAVGTHVMSKFRGKK